MECKPELIEFGLATLEDSHKVAQLEEQRPSKAKVTGSSPVSCTIFLPLTTKMGD